MYGSIVPSIVYRPTDHVRTLFPIITRTHSCLWGRRRSLCLTSNSAKANARATGDRPNEFDAFKWKCQNHQCDPLEDVFSDDFVLQFLLSSDLSFSSCFFSFSFFIIIFFFMLCCQLHFSLLPVLLLLFHMCLLPMFSCVFLSCPFFSTCSDFFSCILLFCLYLSPSLFLFLSFLSQTHPLDDLTPAPAQARAEDQAPRVFVPGWWLNRNSLWVGLWVKLINTPKSILLALTKWSILLLSHFPAGFCNNVYLYKCRPLLGHIQGALWKRTILKHGRYSFGWKLLAPLAQICVDILLATSTSSVE